MEIRQSYNRLISTVGFPKLVRWHFYMELGPDSLPVRVRYGVSNVSSKSDVCFSSLRDVPYIESRVVGVCFYKT